MNLLHSLVILIALCQTVDSETIEVGFTCPPGWKTQYLLGYQTERSIHGNIFSVCLICFSPVTEKTPKIDFCFNNFPTAEIVDADTVHKEIKCYVMTKSKHCDDIAQNKFCGVSFSVNTNSKLTNAIEDTKVTKCEDPTAKGNIKLNHIDLLCPNNTVFSKTFLVSNPLNSHCIACENRTNKMHHCTVCFPPLSQNNFSYTKDDVKDFDLVNNCGYRIKITEGNRQFDRLIPCANEVAEISTKKVPK